MQKAVVWAAWAAIGSLMYGIWKIASQISLWHGIIAVMLTAVVGFLAAFVATRPR